jgi:hypothetical protein
MTKTTAQQQQHPNNELKLDEEGGLVSKGGISCSLFSLEEEQSTSPPVVEQNSPPPNNNELTPAAT